jgi:hypothetical protein
VGQLAFVAAALALLGAVRRLPRPAWRWFEAVPGYAIGSIATFWVVQRITSFWLNT